MKCLFKIEMHSYENEYPNNIFFILSINKTSRGWFQACCKNCSLNPDFCFNDDCKKGCYACCGIQSSNHQNLIEEKNIVKM